MNLIAPPSLRERRGSTRITPAISVATVRPSIAVLLHDAVDDDDERAGRAADLHARAAERGDEEAGDDRGLEAALRRHPARDRERDRERKRDDADDDARRQIAR